MTGTTLGRYRVGALLGRGGMGEVYQAEDLELGRAVALKVLPDAVVGDPERLARFVQEARTASSLNHPHLVAIYEIGQATPAGAARPVHYIAMELVKGETLRAVLAGESRDLKKTLEYLTQAAEALAAAHAAGIVHRDFKPDNVMIAATGYAKVLDFGLAKLRGEPSLAVDATALETMSMTGTTPGLVMGTVGYMSPEQAEGRPADHRSDIFSFGCVLYEAVAGARAFAGTSAVDTLHRIIHDDPAPLPSLRPGTPPDLQRIVRKCLAKDPDDRYQSLREAAIDLRDVRRQLESGPVTAATPAVAPRRPTRLIAGIATAVVVAGVAIAIAIPLLKGRTAAPPAAALRIDRTTSSGLVIDAILSPDGKYLAYVESLGGKQGLWLRQVQGTRPIELVPAAQVGFWGIAFAKDGQSIHFANKSAAETLGALYQVPLLGGSPRLLLRGIDSAITLSPDGSRLAYYRVEPDQGGASSLVIAGADGSNPHALVTTRPPEFLAPGFYVAPSWSPDGARIAGFIRNSKTRDARLMTFDAATGARRPFDATYVDGTFAAWLPDGSGILYTAVERGAFTTGNGGQIFLQPYPSGPPRRVTSDLQDYRNVSLTADGRTFVSVGFDADSRVSLLSTADGTERRTANERYDGVYGVAWLPDSSAIVYSHYLNGSNQLWQMARDGSNKRELVSDGAVGWPAISADGRTLAFVGTRGDSTGIWRAAIDGTSAVLLAPVVGAQNLKFAPDGRSLYFTASIGGQLTTYRLSIDGGTPQRVAALLFRAAVSPDGTQLAGVYRRDERAPVEFAIVDTSGNLIKNFGNVNFATGGGSIQWANDGQSVLYTTAERMNIWRHPIAGGQPQKVTNFSDLVISRFALSPDGQWIALCRGVVARDAFIVSNFR
jgi:Tol biopolymer transport system component